MHLTFSLKLISNAEDFLTRPLKLTTRMHATSNAHQKSHSVLGFTIHLLAGGSLYRSIGTSLIIVSDWPSAAAESQQARWRIILNCWHVAWGLPVHFLVRWRLLFLPGRVRSMTEKLCALVNTRKEEGF